MSTLRVYRPLRWVVIRTFMCICIIPVQYSVKDGLPSLSTSTHVVSACHHVLVHSTGCMIRVDDVIGSLGAYTQMVESHAGQTHRYNRVEVRTPKTCMCMLPFARKKHIFHNAFRFITLTAPFRLAIHTAQRTTTTTLPLSSAETKPPRAHMSTSISEAALSAIFKHFQVL